MRKAISMTFMALMVLSVFPMVSASALFGQSTDTLNLYEKNPSDWSIVNNGATGVVEFSTVGTPWRILQERVRVTVHGLEPKTEYQLIYYGNDQVNDVWPYVTCIGKPRRTSTQGYFKSGSTKFNHLEMQNDGLAQKLWVVLADDVDCNAGKMIDWNPTEYLFEEHTI